MSWLLDTHVWVWSQLEPERLGPDAVALLEDPLEVLYVSPISTLEIARLREGGRLSLTVSVEDWVGASLDLLSALTLDLGHRVAAEAHALPEPFHRDPADRVLVASARSHDLTLLTADERILAYPHVRSRDARR